MIKYIIKRLALSVLILFCVSVIMFVLIQLMPMDYVTQQIAAIETKGEAVSEETVQALMSEYGYGTDGTLGGMFRGYFTWLRATLRLDFGTSFKFQQPVADVIAKNMWVSFAVAAIATVFEFMIASPLGITAATHQYSFRDYFVTVLVMIGISLPSFFFGQILKNMLAMQLGWFPSSGLGSATMDYTGIWLVLDYISYLVIPVLTVVVLSIGGRMRMTRTNMLEVLGSDYIRTARAKGATQKIVIWRHALKNALMPIITVLGMNFGALLGGAVITESVFTMPGLGTMIVTGIRQRDLPCVMGATIILAFMFGIIMLVADLLYAFVDPRIKAKYSK